MTRLTLIDPSERSWLAPTDHCYHYGEYTSRGGYGASDTNNWIDNLKKKPSAPASQLTWKARAVAYWGDILRSAINLDKCGGVTFVPIPGSKPAGHADFDNRMLRVLHHMAGGRADIDIRVALVQNGERDPQHSGTRKTPSELLESLQVDTAALTAPLRPNVYIVDDVITQGASFNAAAQLLRGAPHVEHVFGVFLAKTVWPQVNPFEAFPALPD